MERSSWAARLRPSLCVSVVRRRRRRSGAFRGRFFNGLLSRWLCVAAVVRPPAVGILLLSLTAICSGEERIDWIAFGGGAEPVSNQVSLEQDLALARKVLRGSGVLLFAGGPGSQGVQIRHQRSKSDPLLLDLGELFDPRDGRSSIYRPTILPAQGPATLDGVEAALESALGQSSGPLLVYVAAHGERGKRAAETSIDLWGGFKLSVASLAELIEKSSTQRRVRFVITSCYSGGFGELAFAAADSEKGPAPTDRCGFFAATADEIASGCDPNPD